MGAVRVNQDILIVPAIAAGAVEPTGFGALRFDDGFVAAHLASGALPANAETHDSFGFATGALGFELSPQGHEMAEILVSCLPAAAGAPPTGEPAFEWGTRLPLDPVDRQTIG